MQFLLKQYNIAKQNYDRTVDENIRNLIANKDYKCLDPDKSSFYDCEVDGIIIRLAQDGLCSHAKMQKYSEDIVSDYELIRKDMFDCLVWPAYALSINQMRSIKYNDRIDLLLMDIERFFSVVNSKTVLTPQITEAISENCDLGRAFLFAKTFYWLRCFGDFNEFVRRRKFQAFVEIEGGHFRAKPWTNTTTFDKTYYLMLLDKIREYKKQ